MQVRQHIPNLLTLGNLVCGSLAILYVFQGTPRDLVLLFALCLVFDFADGLAARVLKASSEIGKQLDSFADLISFGLFPGILLFTHIHSTLTANSWQILPFIALLIPIFSAIRLAIFNLSAPKQHFRGLPTPANAALLLSYVWIPTFIPESLISPWLTQTPVLMGLVLLSCFLLLAPLSLLSIKFSDFSLSNNWPSFLLVLLGLVGLMLYQFLAIPFIILIYLMISLLVNPH